MVDLNPFDSGNIFGPSNNGSPNWLGGGMYGAPNYNIDTTQFANPNFQPGQYQQQANNYLGATTGGIQAAQAAPGSYGNYNTGTAGQLGLAQQYGQMAAGQGPSLATVQAQQQGQANLAGAESMLGSARGAGSPAAAQLAARTAQTQGAQQVAQNAIQGRTQEELAALGAQGGLYGNIGSQGLQQTGLQQQLGVANAGQANQIAQGNQANRLAANTNYLNSLANQGLAQQQGGMAGQQLGVQQQLGLGNIGQQAYSNAAQRQQNITGGIMQGIGGLFGGVGL